MDLYASLEGAKKSQSMDGMINIPMRSKDWEATVGKMEQETRHQ